MIKTISGFSILKGVHADTHYQLIFINLTFKKIKEQVIIRYFHF